MIFLTRITGRTKSTRAKKTLLSKLQDRGVQGALTESYDCGACYNRLANEFLVANAPERVWKTPKEG